MIDEVPVDTALTARVEDESPGVPAEVTAAENEAAPKRRRVRRKVATAPEDDVAVEVEAGTSVPPSPVEPGAPSEAAPTVEEAAETPEAVVASKPVTPRKTVAVEEILASDPNQITAPPPKPKRGWWRL